METATQFIVENWHLVIIEVVILWVIIYQTYRYFRATRGARIFTALIIIYLLMAILSDQLDLRVIGWLLRYISVILAVALIIIFQPELRRALAELGSHRFFSSLSEQSRQRFIDQFVEIVTDLSRKRVGALIAIERGIDLKQYLETGVEMDSKLSPELVGTIFHNGTILHDGGLIVRMSDERIAGAGCVFPLNQRELSDRSIGLRHRASMGITEESDAIALVVSEETGAISIGVEGELFRNLDEEEIRERLGELLLNESTEEDDGEYEGDERRQD
ncbi:MAG: diadenylate cyclase CdaA [Verrucomicrobiales bacterium]|nr:diadenylate cyclase CdaA [Verrucomicrobiales bacterium]